MVAIVAVATAIAFDLRKNSNLEQLVLASQVNCNSSPCPKISVVRENGEEYYVFLMNNSTDPVSKVVFEIDGKSIPIQILKPQYDDSYAYKGLAKNLSSTILKGSEVSFTIFFEDSPEKRFIVKTENESTKFFNDLKSNYPRI